MTIDRRYEIIASPKMAADLHLLRSRAQADPAQHGHLYRETLREIEKLRYGTSDGHHPLGYAAGKGDMRDCVTSYVQSDAQKKADHRLVFREMGPAAPGQLPRRELLAIKPRQGSGDIYEHTCARLARHPNDMQPGLDRFGRRPASSGGNQAARQAELATSKPLDMTQFGQRGTPAHSPGPTRDPGRER